VNPIISEGALRAVQFDFRLGRARELLGLVSRNALELSALFSSPQIDGSEFDFARYEASLEWSVRTFSRSLLFSPAFRLKLSAGTSNHNPPPQYIFTLESRSTGYAPFGVLRGAGIKELTGDKFVMINIEHNFRNVPFLALNIPFLYRNNIELITHASFAQSWFGSTSSTDGWYAEAGIGVGRLLDMIRCDFTYRFQEPRRLYVTVGLATFF
jgi:hypothetical protein